MFNFSLLGYVPLSIAVRCVRESLRLMRFSKLAYTKLESTIQNYTVHRREQWCKAEVGGGYKVEMGYTPLGIFVEHDSRKQTSRRKEKTMWNFRGWSDAIIGSVGAGLPKSMTSLFPTFRFFAASRLLDFFSLLFFSDWRVLHLPVRIILTLA